MRKLFKYPLYEILDEMTFSDIADGGAVIVAGADVKNQLARYDERCFTAASALKQRRRLYPLYIVYLRQRIRLI